MAFVDRLMMYKAIFTSYTEDYLCTTWLCTPLYSHEYHVSTYNVQVQYHIGVGTLKLVVGMKCLTGVTCRKLR